MRGIVVIVLVGIVLAAVAPTVRAIVEEWWAAQTDWNQRDEGS